MKLTSLQKGVVYIVVAFGIMMSQRLITTFLIRRIVSEGISIFYLQNIVISIVGVIPLILYFMFMRQVLHVHRIFLFEFVLRCVGFLIGIVSVYYMYVYYRQLEGGTYDIFINFVSLASILSLILFVLKVVVLILTIGNNQISSNIKAPFITMMVLSLLVASNARGILFNIFNVQPSFVTGLLVVTTVISFVLVLITGYFIYVSNTELETKEVEPHQDMYDFDY